MLFFVFIGFLYFYGYAYLVFYVHKVTKLEHQDIFFFAHFEFQHPGMHYTHLFIFFLVSHFFAFFQSHFVMGLVRSIISLERAHYTSCAVALASSVCEITRQANLGCKEEQAKSLHLRSILSYKCARQLFIVTVSLQLSDDLVHFFILKPFERKCCQSPSEDDPATLNASSERQQFHNFSRTLLQFKKEEKRFFLFTIKGSVLPGIYICTMDVSLKRKRSFLNFLSFLLLPD